MKLRVTILGCGSSGGVPRPGLGWGACDPSNPRNRRRRCSILVERHGPEGVTRVLVDTSPDLRDQLLDADVKWLDGVLYTHEHADHTHGIDDLRGLAQYGRKRINIHADAATGAMLRARFGYCFETPPGSDYPPILAEHRIEPDREVSVDGPGGPIVARPFQLLHGSMPALGFRFADVAYTPDLHAIPQAAERHLEGLDIWIVDALRPAPHPSHFSLGDALAAIERFRPRRAILTNMHVDLDHETLRGTLPDGIEPAYDGLVIESDAAAHARNLTEKVRATA